ncbi:diguanylate cyclase [Pelomonas sp. SE-A7]|uniref:diguanylate cyclase n=1 Tax=Pelomonas sp. SE-A7 TaxID=3054953 RepID=UPI00259CAF06|nr:diguanylate cyclase [Pelomonas sp. SE-A7]MDM4768078.1 diguanylate cyclase [Pelomonas sp. SE-A7]
MERHATTPRWTDRLSELLFTGERVQRIRLIQASLALVLMAVCVAIMQYAAWVNGLSSAPLAWWTGLSLGGLLGAYLLIRSGWSKRLADPSLTVPQMVYAIACGAVGYGMAGPLRGAVFPILMTILVFGMFQLRAGTTLRISLYALGLFGLTMAFMAHWRPAQYPPAVELGHFLMLVCTLPAVSVLAGRISRIRHRLAEQKSELAEALAQIQALATHDELTGLLNRRHMQTLLDQEVQRCQRSGQSFCVALLDIDHFKRVNDRHGHGTGDAVLRGFADVAQAAIRASDVLARWGGEEFVLLMADSRMPPALAGVERVREHVEALRVPAGEVMLSTSVSAGLTQHRPGETLAQTLERADRLLYQAKSEGRNRVVIG